MRLLIRLPNPPCYAAPVQTVEKTSLSIVLVSRVLLELLEMRDITSSHGGSSPASGSLRRTRRDSACQTLSSRGNKRGDFWM